MLRGVWTLLSMTGIPRLIVRLMLDRRVPIRHKLILPIALVYIILPIDLLPDFIPMFIGRIDDLLVLILAGVWFILSVPREVLMEVARGEQPPEEGSKKPDDGTTVIEGEYRKLDE